VHRGGKGKRQEVPPLETYIPSMRVPPHALDAEMAVLGAVLMAGPHVWHEVQGLAVEDFYKQSHRVIFAAMQRVAAHQGADALDVLTVVGALRDQAHGDHDLTQLDAAGGLAYVASLSNAVSTAANAPHYAAIVARKARQREVLALMQDATERCYGAVDDLPAMLMDHAGAVLEVAHGGQGDGVGARVAVERVYAKLQAQIEGVEKIHCLSLGLPSVDDMLGGGIKTGKYIVAQALTNHGKSVFANHIIERSQDPLYSVMGQDAQGQERRLPGWWTLYFSTEIPCHEACMNLMGYMGGFWPKHVEDDIMGLGGQMEGSRAWKGFIDAARRLRSLDVTFFDQTKGLTSTIIAGTTLRHMHLEQREAERQGRAPRPGLVVVDYIQDLRDAAHGKGESNYERLMLASRELRDLAKRNPGLAVVATAQTHNRAKAERRPPGLEDVRDMPGCNSDVDVMLGICRPSRYLNTLDPQQYHVASLKGRQADTSEVMLRFRTDKGGRLEEDAEWVPKGGFVQWDALRPTKRK